MNEQSEAADVVWGWTSFGARVHAWPRDDLSRTACGLANHICEKASEADKRRESCKRCLRRVERWSMPL